MYLLVYTLYKLPQHYEELLQSNKVKLVSLVHASNVLGSHLDVK